MARDLSRREQEILLFLVAVDAPGVAELRQQAEVALVDRNWDNGPSIDILVDRARAQPSPIRRSPAIEAVSNERDVREKVFELLLFLEGGWLAAIELVEYGEARSTEFPPPSAFAPARLYELPSRRT